MATQEQETKWNIVVGVLTNNLEILERNSYDFIKYLALKDQFERIKTKRETLKSQNKPIEKLTNEARMLLYKVNQAIDIELERQGEDNDK